jgi:hypothetical protein
MVRVFVLVAWAAVSVSPAFAEDPDVPKGKPSVGVYLDFDSVPGVVPLEIMKREVDKILKPSGVALDWRLTRENHGDEAFAGLVVLRFRGKCKIETWTSAESDLPRLGDDTQTLGTTKVANGHVLPFSEVRCDQVKKALAYLHSDQKDRQRAFGLALGRVVAHELYHILARTTSHAAMGLAKATEPLEELIAPRGLFFRDQETRAIRNSFIGQ